MLAVGILQQGQAFPSPFMCVCGLCIHKAVTLLPFFILMNYLNLASGNAFKPPPVTFWHYLMHFCIPPTFWDKKMFQTPFFFFFKLIYLIFVYFWLRWIFVAALRLSLVAVSGGYSLFQCVGFSSGSRCTGFSSCGSRALERRLSSCGSRA